MAGIDRTQRIGGAIAALRTSQAPRAVDRRPGGPRVSSLGARAALPAGLSPQGSLLGSLLAALMLALVFGLAGTSPGSPGAASQDTPTGPPVLREEATIGPGRESGELRFGWALAFAGTALAVASPRDGDGGQANGLVHVFGDSRRGWRRVQRLQGDKPAENDRFGSALAGSGSRIVVGRDHADGSAEDAGSATVFRRVGYHFRAESELSADDAMAGDMFGSAVAIAGRLAVVGAPRDDEAGLDSGSAYVFAAGDDGWELVEKLVPSDGAAGDWFGSAVATDGTSVAIGAFGHDGAGGQAGAVYLFRRTGVGFGLETKLLPTDLQPGDWFGFSVAMAEDELAVGAPRDGGAGESAGSVRTFRRDDRGWTAGPTLRPPSGAATVWFGYALALEPDRLLVGAPGDDAEAPDGGAARLFVRDPLDESWRLGVTLAPSKPATKLQFGSAVAIRGDLAAIGRPYLEDGRQVEGRVWIYRLRGKGRGVSTHDPEAPASVREADTATGESGAPAERTAVPPVRKNRSRTAPRTPDNAGRPAPETEPAGNSRIPRRERIQRVPRIQRIERIERASGARGAAAAPANDAVAPDPRSRPRPHGSGRAPPPDP
jgi:hypothetical protein